ncbi:MAG: signal peptidase I [Anaerolineaceae bacterium]|nr:signal peptidase I [Anaerolineaceae bacterium]
MLNNQNSEPITENHEAEPQKGSKKSSCMGFVIDTVETILLALILFLGINAVSARVRVENVSMEPTLMPNEFLLVNRVAYKIGTPKIGDIIIFHAPGADDLDYIKRLIGRPGDTVRIEGGVVYVNDQALYENYILETPNYTGTWEVPEGQFFVLGDNRNNSSDSHLWGFIPEDSVVGKALLIYWPLDAVSLLTGATPVQAAQ